MRNAIFAIAVALPVACTAQQFDATREWTDTSGKFSVSATFEQMNASHVQIKKQDGSTVPIPRSRLSESDQNYLRAVEALQETDQQAEVLLSHVSAAIDRPRTLVEIIRAIRDKNPNAFFANLMSGFVYAAAGRTPTDLRYAASHTDTAIEQLSTIEEHFSGLQRKSLISALNNRAVICIRQGSLLGAVNNLTKAASLSPDHVPFAVYHNASLILESGVLEAKHQSRLATVLASQRPEGVESAPRYLMYSLDFSRLTLSEASEKTEQPVPDTAAIKAPRGRFKLGTGSGFLVSPTLVLTNRHVAEDASDFVVKNDSGYIGNATPGKVSAAEEIDLALLVLDKPADMKPIPLKTDDPMPGQSLNVLGYPIPDEFGASLSVTQGVVSKVLGFDVQHDAATDGGNSGGPCIDQFGNAIGVHYGGSLIAKNARNFAVSPSGISQFLSGHGSYSQLPALTTEKPFTEILQDTKDSVFIVEIYANEMPSVSVPASADETVMSKYRLYADTCCLACSGKGHVDCPACANGFTSTSQRVQVATNSITGAPVYANKAIKKKCGNCSRGGLIRCPRCGGSGSIK